MSDLNTSTSSATGSSGASSIFKARLGERLKDKLKGAKVRDGDFDKRREACKDLEADVKELQHLMSSFRTIMENMAFVHKSVGIQLLKMYTDIPGYTRLANYMAENYLSAAQKLEHQLMPMEQAIERFDDMGSQFTELRELWKMREKTRLNFQHYDNKIKKLKDKRLEKSNRDKHYTPSAKEREKINRNEGKFDTAKEAYVADTTRTYEAMNAVLMNRFDVINPIVCQYSETQFQTLHYLKNAFADLEGITQKFDNSVHELKEYKDTMIRDVERKRIQMDDDTAILANLTSFLRTENDANDMSTIRDINFIKEMNQADEGGEGEPIFENLDSSDDDASSSNASPEKKPRTLEDKAKKGIVKAVAGKEAADALEKAEDAKQTGEEVKKQLDDKVEETKQKAEEAKAALNAKVLAAQEQIKKAKAEDANGTTSAETKVEGGEDSNSGGGGIDLV